MKTFSLITSPFSKLLYVELFSIASNQKGVIKQHQLLDIVFSSSFEKGLTKDFQYLLLKENGKEASFDTVAKKTKLARALTKSFLFEIGKNWDFKFFELSKSDFEVGDFFFTDVFEKEQEKKLFEIFNKNGIDPFLFLKTAMANSKKKGRYLFDNLSESFAEIERKEKERLLSQLDLLKQEIDYLETKKAMLERDVARKEYSLNSKNDLPQSSAESKSVDTIVEVSEKGQSKDQSAFFAKEDESKQSNGSWAKLNKKVKDKSVKETTKINLEQSLTQTDNKIASSSDFSNVGEVVNATFQDNEFEKAIPTKLLKVNKSKQVGSDFCLGESSEWHSDENISTSIKKVFFNTEKLFDTNAIELKFAESEEGSIKDVWKDLREILVNEGKTISQANALIAKQAKILGSYNLMKISRRVMQVKPLPSNFMAYCVFLFDSEKESVKKNDLGNVFGQSVF